jgi:hypothetical protein
MFIGLVIFELYDGVAPYLTEKIGGRHAYSNNHFVVKKKQRFVFRFGHQSRVQKF